MKPKISRKQQTWLRRVLASRMKRTFVVPVVGAGLLMGAMALSANADPFIVGGAAPNHHASLSAAITASNASGTNNIISFENAIVLNAISLSMWMEMLTPLRNTAIFLELAG